MEKLQKILGYQFSDIKILKTALTHKSAGKQHYEKLEFLGDSILNYCISSLIFQKLDELDEGKLSILRAKLVSKSTLNQLGEKLAIDPYIRTDNQHISDALRADVVEAIIGGMYLDGGISACHTFIQENFKELIQSLASQDLKDPKSHLQELTHQLKKAHPVYGILITEGKSHETIYTVCCTVGDVKTQAKSQTKRQAEKEAAKRMIHILKETNYA